DSRATEHAATPPPPPSGSDIDQAAGSEPEVDPDVPHSELAPVVFFCLKQTSFPRNWCIKLVCNPYPLLFHSFRNENQNQ
uniref:Uncharacterized protein n=1 Tax=Latimeria chalumnae TaxID=7897 RepID=H3A6K8_LATCH